MQLKPQNLFFQIQYFCKQQIRLVQINTRSEQEAFKAESC